MSTFKLDMFPYVCQLCLEPASNSRLMVSLNSRDSVLDDTVGGFLTAITFEICKTKSLLVPQQVCFQCLDLLKFFSKYRSKLMAVHLLIDALAELKRSNPKPIGDLFEQKDNRFKDLLRDLDLCNGKDATLQDLLDEFDTYAIAAIVEKGYKNEKGKLEENDDERLAEDPEKSTDDTADTFFAEELGSDQIDELLNDRPKSKVGARKRGGAKLSEPLKCTKCIFQTFYQRTFESHQQTHLEQGGSEIRCQKPGCTEVFQLCNDYYKHCIKMHKEYVCETCGLKCASKSCLARHQERHLQQYNHTCPYCQRRFNLSNDVTIHVRLVHFAEDSYPCRTCGMEFKRKHSRDAHEKSHEDVYDFPCTMCDKKFKTTTNLRRHCIEVHERKRLICQYCSKTYPKSVKLKDHIESVHGIQQRFICDICVKTLLTQEDLDAHLSFHANPGPLACGTCLMVFPSDDQMKAHLCITYRDDYICCERDFRQAYMYNKHMLTKHGVKTNVRVKPIPGQLAGAVRAKRKRIESCPKCEAIFPTRTKKKQHMDNCTGTAQVGWVLGIIGPWAARVDDSREKNVNSKHICIFCD